MSSLSLLLIMEKSLRALFFILTAAVALPLWGASDSIPEAFPDSCNSVYSSRWNVGSYASVPALATGLALWGAQHDYRNSSRPFPHTHSTLFGDYGGYSPLVVTAALKLCGVESRSSWGRLASSASMSAALMGVMGYGLKYSVNEWRPDRDSRHSFPSGHTAAAFMCAAIMSREYGWRSPWFSVGAYTVASSVGMLRAARNHHWAGDVVFGAGVGVLSVELGYLLTDLIFRNRGLAPGSCTPLGAEFNSRPSFFSVGMGAGSGSSIRLHVPLGSGRQTEMLRLKAGATTSAAAEGAWFFAKYFGVGGRLRMLAAPLTPSYRADDSAQDSDGLMSATMQETDAVASVYGVWQPASRWQLGANIGVGVRWTGQTDFKSEDGLLLHLARTTSPEGVAGLSVAYALRNNSALRINAAYDLSRPGYTATCANESVDLWSATTHSTASRFSLSATFAILF